jgi:hypothetical protein
MERNVGGLDRTGRLVIGAILAVAGIAALLEYWAAGPIVGGVALAVGAILLVTGATRKCPLNLLAGINTAKK